MRRRLQFNATLEGRSRGAQSTLTLPSPAETAVNAAHLRLHTRLGTVGMIAAHDALEAAMDETATRTATAAAAHVVSWHRIDALAHALTVDRGGY